MTQWQHRREFVPDARLIRELDAIGADGWQLCSIVSATWEGHAGYICIFKRPKGKPR